MMLRRRTRDVAALATLSAFVGLALAGCTPSTDGGETGGNVELTVWTFLSREGETPREVVLNELLTQFEADNPGVKVTVEAQPFEELESKFITASQRGDEPDLIWARDTFLYLLDDAGSLMNLDAQLSEEFADEALPDMYDVFTNKAVFDDRRIALPLWPTPAQILFYRADVLAAAGYPDGPPTNWGELLDVLPELTDGNQFGLGLQTNDSGVTPYLMLMNGFADSPFDQEGKFDLLGPESMQVAQTLRELGQSEYVPADAVSATGDDLQDQFASGRYAIAMAFAPRFTAFVDGAAGYDPATLKVSAWPSFDSDDPSVLMGPYWNVGVSANSEHPAEAVALLESFYSTDASLMWAQDAGQVPDRRSVLENEYFATDAGKIIADQVTIIESEGARVPPQRVEDVAQMANILNGATQRLLGTDEDIEKILNDTKAELGW